MRISRYDLLVSALYPDKPEFHNRYVYEDLRMVIRLTDSRAKDEMKILVKKFPGGFEDWEARQVSSPRDL